MQVISAADSREEFDGLLEDAGIWVIYTRTDRRFPCRTCRSAPDEKARDDCRTCFGTGFKAELEPWRIQWANELRRPAEQEVPLTQMGFNLNNTPVIFSRAVDIPQSGDRVFMVEWDREWEAVPHGGRPTRLIQAFHIKLAEPYFIREIVYYVSHCNYVTDVANQLWRAIAPTPLLPARL
jgi:hypothetical protein